MNKALEFYKRRWKDRRVGIGYILWLGVSIGILILSLFGIKIETWAELITLIVMHFFGAYLVFRYHLFAVEVDNNE